MGLVLTKLSTSGGGSGKALPFPGRKGRAVSQRNIAHGTKGILSFRDSRVPPLGGRLPPQISDEKKAPSRQSLQKSLCPSSPLRRGLLRPHAALRKEPYFASLIPQNCRRITESWNEEILGLCSIRLKNITIHEISKSCLG